MSSRVHLRAARSALALALVALLMPTTAQALETPSWRLVPVYPPTLSGGQESNVPIGLGRVGDIEFWGRNRGLLITAGNPPTIPPGVWAYNGVSWHELATVCGATDGRIAWAGPDEFWTVSDGRPGQAETEHLPPLADNTLCHFAGSPGPALQVVGSYASLAFRADSYQAMHGAACFDASDCWFAGDVLPDPELQTGAFQLHWNGGSLTAQPNPQGRAVEDMRRFGRYLYEGVRVGAGDKLTFLESPSAPSDLHLITPIGVQPTFVSLTPGVPKYAAGEAPAALDFLHLSSDATALWGVADPAEAPEGSLPGEVTIVRYAENRWSQLLGPGSDPAAGNPFTKFLKPEGEQEEQANERVDSIAAEPGGEKAWLTLSSGENAARGALAPALVASISSAGEVSDRQALPAGGEGPTRGAADKLACPAPADCWLATTRGWLFHLTTNAARQAEESHPDGDPAFANPNPVTFRPPDAGIPPVVPDAPPVDDSGLLGEAPAGLGSLAQALTAPSELRVPVPLISHVRTRLRRRTTLELRFHLAVTARVRLLARRRRVVVASTPMRVLSAGDRTLLLRLDVHRWPTKLDLQTHALAPLPTTSTRGAGTTTVGTALHVLPGTPSFRGTGTLP